MLLVPPGTVVYSKTQVGDSLFIVDLDRAGEQVVVVEGGRGGLGNTHFASPTNQAPQIAQKGELGEEKRLVLELKLIADVGIVGYPNAGKSTLLAAVSAARPKIAGYPFTTCEPVLGVVEVGGQDLVLAEIPGLVAGAHLGRGMGHDFLRHVERTRVLIHLVDGSAASPVENMAQVNAELGLFDSALARKPQLVVVNKIDLPEIKDRLSEIKEAFKSAGMSPLFISAATGAGVPELMARTAEVLGQFLNEKSREAVPKRVFYPQPRAVPQVRREGEAFIIEAPALERIVAGAALGNPEVLRQLRRALDRGGVRRVLEKAGVKPGDTVRCGDFAWKW